MHTSELVFPRQIIHMLAYKIHTPTNNSSWHDWPNFHKDKNSSTCMYVIIKNGISFRVMVSTEENPFWCIGVNKHLIYMTLHVYNLTGERPASVMWSRDLGNLHDLDWWDKGISVAHVYYVHTCMWSPFHRKWHTYIRARARPRKGRHLRMHCFDWEGEGENYHAPHPFPLPLPPPPHHHTHTTYIHHVLDVFPVFLFICTVI